MKKQNNSVTTNFIGIRNKHRILIVILLSCITFSCSLLNTKGKYSDYTAEDIDKFIERQINAPNFIRRRNAGQPMEVSKKEKEVLGVKASFIAFYVNKSSQSEVVVDASSFSAIAGTSDYIRLQTEFINEDGGKVISSEKHPTGKTVTFRKNSPTSQVMIIDCREGLCLTFTKEAGEKDSDIAMTFYQEIDKEKFFKMF